MTLTRSLPATASDAEVTAAIDELTAEVEAAEPGAAPWGVVTAEPDGSYLTAVGTGPAPWD